ncbi:MAG: hypothetical protein IKZ19_05175 [Clostridia bacterium]|nr:hypothetical protein [Clostridia bacterium]
MSFMSFVRGMILGMLAAALAVFVFFPKRRRRLRQLRRRFGRAGRKISAMADGLWSIVF